MKLFIDSADPKEIVGCCAMAPGWVGAEGPLMHKGLAVFLAGAKLKAE